MNKNKVKTCVGVLALSSIFVIGCTKEDEGSLKKAEQGNGISVNEGVDAKEQAKEDAKIPEKTAKEKEQKAKADAIQAKKDEAAKTTIWIPNVEYISSGDESIPKLKKVEVVGVGANEESDNYMRLLKTLNKCGDSPIQLLTFNSVQVNGDTLDIDIADPTKLGIGGSTTELVLLEQLKTNIFDVFKEVNKIQLKVDGKITDNFLGHVDISEPLSR